LEEFMELVMFPLVLAPLVVEVDPLPLLAWWLLLLVT
jgi:hypothetical protein